MSKRKFTNIFLRKDDRRDRGMDQPQIIDESFFQCQILWDPQSLSLIKIQVMVVKGGGTDDAILLNCKWYWKTKFDFREIEGVKTSYYQPCLDDVGGIICVHIQPYLEGKTYQGVTIIKEVGPITIPTKIEHQCHDFLMQKSITLGCKVEAIFSQDQRFQFVETPLESELRIESRKVHFIRQSNREQVCCYDICDKFPEISIIRKSFNAMLISLNEKESMKLSFPDNLKRDLFALIIRNLIANPDLQTDDHLEEDEPSADRSEEKLQEQQQDNYIQDIDLPTQNQQSETKQQQSRIDFETKIEENETETLASSVLEVEKSDYKQKTPEKEPKSQKSQNLITNSTPSKSSFSHSISSTALVLKIGELNKDNQQLQRDNEQLKQNYHIERQAKLSISNQLDKLQSENQKLKKRNQNVREVEERLKKTEGEVVFLCNEISLRRLQMKNLKQSRQAISEQRDKFLQEVTQFKVQMRERPIAFQNKSLQDLSVVKQLYQKIQQSQRQLETLQESSSEVIQQKQADINWLNKKIQSLIVEAKRSPPKNVTDSSCQTSQIERTKNRSDFNEEDIRNQSKAHIERLQFQIKNLEMLLRYKSGDKRHESFGLQKIVNKLTQNITEKELEVHSLKEVNKQLSRKINALLKK